MVDVVKVPYGSENQWTSLTDNSIPTPVPDTPPVVASPDTSPGITKVPYGSENQWTEEPTIPPSGNGFGTGGVHTTDTQAAANRSSLGNYVHGLKEGASNFSNMITDGVNSPDITGAIPSISKVGRLAHNANEASNLVGNALVDSIPFSDRIDAVGGVTSDAWNGMKKNGVQWPPVDKAGNPLNLTDDYNRQLDTIHAQSQTAENATSPQFYDALKTAGGMAIPGAIINKVATVPAGLGTKIIGGAVMNVPYSAAQAVSSNPNLEDWDTTFKNAGIGAAMGLATGLAVPAISAGIGKVAHGALDLAYPSKIYDPSTPEIGTDFGSRMTNPPRPEVLPEAKTQILNATIAEDNPDSAVARMKIMGPEATPADVSKSIKNLAVPGASTPPKTISDTENFLNQRAANAPDRINQDLQQAVGPMTDTQRSAASDLVDQTKIIGQNELRPLLKSAPDIDTKPLVDAIDSHLNNAAGDPVAVGSEQKALQQIRNLLVTPSTPGTPSTLTRTLVPGTKATYTTTGSLGIPPTPQSTVIPAEKLNNVRQYIADLTTFGDTGLNINSGAEARRIGSIKDIYGQAKDLLNKSIPDTVDPTTGATIPGYENTMNRLAPLFKQREAVNFGANALKDGSSFEDFRKDLYTQYPDPASRAAAQTGMKYDLYNRKNNAINDPLAIRKVMQDYTPTSGVDYDPTGPGQGNNSKKIEALFGPSAREMLQNGGMREVTFDKTKNDLIGGSATQSRLASSKALEEGEPKDQPLVSPSISASPTGIAFKLAGGAVNSAGKMFQTPANPGLYRDQLTKFATTPGNKGQNALVQALRSSQNTPWNNDRSQALVRLLTRGLGVGSSAPSVFNNENK